VHESFQSRLDPLVGLVLGDQKVQVVEVELEKMIHSIAQSEHTLRSHPEIFEKEIMLTRIIKSGRSSAIYQSLRFESISVGSVRAGMILKMDDQYVEVKKYEPKREGRGGAMGAVCDPYLPVCMPSDRIRRPYILENRTG
jgi:hypothetical protein